MLQQDIIVAQLRRGCDKLEIEVQPNSLAVLHQYFIELRRWSRRINLIARRTDDLQIVENHFLDSLLLLPYLRSSGRSLLDVGTGAGFPGLVCKAAHPALSLILVEPRLKRVSFLRHIIRSLQLQNIEVIASRVERIDRVDVGCITSRAVADIELFLHMAEPLAGPETDIVCMKGPLWREELERASATLQQKRLVLSRFEEFELPTSGAQRALLFFNREKNDDPGSKR